MTKFSNLFISFFQFYHSFLTNKTIDVLFYYPQHFNVGSNKIRSLDLLLEICKQNNITYILIEEPNFISRTERNKDAIKFDYFFLIILFFRRLFFWQTDTYLKDEKIGKLLSFLFIKKNNVKNIITISQSMQHFLKNVFNQANIYDYQHGVISNKYEGYFLNNEIAPNLIKNKVKVLIHGQKVKQQLVNIDGGDYFKNNAIVVGGPIRNYGDKKLEFNGNILFSLQFTNSHSLSTNLLLLNETIKLFKMVEQKQLNVNFYLKHHPRFDNCIDISELYKFKFVLDSPKSIEECFATCSLHLTEYSTMVFDGLCNGIPSLFTRFCTDFCLFENDFNFPYSEIDFFDALIKLYDNNFYQQLLDKQTKASKEFYQAFDKGLFLKLLS